MHCELRDAKGRPYLLRYKKVAKRRMPLTIKSSEDISFLLKRFGKLRPRTFYASASVYRVITYPEQMRNTDNIAFCLPTWDIDNVVDKWEATMATAKEIVNFLGNAGASKSVFLKWSGKGAHIHIHHRAFSTELLRRINPLDAAYAIVEYVNGQLRSRYMEIAERYQATKLKVENEMDLQRVFTSPLSLHRSLNLAAVCFSLDMIDHLLRNGLRLNATATGKAGTDLNLEKPMIWQKKRTESLEPTYFEKFLNLLDEKQR